MFDENFEVFLADTNESKEIHYSIRYQVYCEEMGFENKDDFPLGHEFDEYDNHSIHFIVRHKQSKQWIGSIRLILKNDQLLPIERHCILDEPIDKNWGRKTVEVSRVCVIKGIRRRVSDANALCGITDENEDINETDKVKLLHNYHRINRTIIWGMLNACLEYCYFNNIQNWYSMTPTPLAKIMERGGFKMLRAGEPIYHKGERYPFKRDVFETYHNEIWRNDYKNGYRKFSELKFSRMLGEIAA